MRQKMLQPFVKNGHFHYAKAHDFFFAPQKMETVLLNNVVFLTIIELCMVLKMLYWQCVEIKEQLH